MFRLNKNKADPLRWARGRLIAIRPDGARKSFDPEATMLLRTDKERDDAAAGLGSLYDEVKARADTRPDWLSDQPDGM